MMTNLDQVISLDSLDLEYGFGRPELYVTPIELARLLIARSKLGDTRAERAAENIATWDRRSFRAEQIRESVQLASITRKVTTAPSHARAARVV